MKVTFFSGLAGAAFAGAATVTGAACTFTRCCFFGNTQSSEQVSGFAFGVDFGPDSSSFDGAGHVSSIARPGLGDTLSNDDGFGEAETSLVDFGVDASSSDASSSNIGDASSFIRGVSGHISSIAGDADVLSSDDGLGEAETSLVDFGVDSSSSDASFSSSSSDASSSGIGDTSSSIRGGSGHVSSIAGRSGAVVQVETSNNSVDDFGVASSSDIVVASSSSVHSGSANVFCTDDHGSSSKVHNSLKVSNDDGFGTGKVHFGTSSDSLSCRIEKKKGDSPILPHKR
jgi:hypothetical protein